MFTKTYILNCTYGCLIIVLPLEDFYRSCSYNFELSLRLKSEDFFKTGRQQPIRAQDQQTRVSNVTSESCPSFLLWEQQKCEICNSHLIINRYNWTTWHKKPCKQKYTATRRTGSFTKTGLVSFWSLETVCMNNFHCRRWVYFRLLYLNVANISKYKYK